MGIGAVILMQCALFEFVLILSEVSLVSKRVYKLTASLCVNGIHDCNCSTTMLPSTTFSMDGIIHQLGAFGCYRFEEVSIIPGHVCERLIESNAKQGLHYLVIIILANTGMMFPYYFLL